MPPQKPLTSEEIERLKRKMALGGTPTLDKAVNNPQIDEDWLTKVENATSNPWVQGGLIGGSLLLGGVPAAILGAAEGVSAGVSAYNRYREGNLGQAALTAALGGLGGVQAVRGVKNVVKGAQIAKAGALAGKTAEEILAARKAANLDPSWASPEVRWVKGKLEARSAARAARVPPGMTAAPSVGPVQGPQGGPIGNAPTKPTMGVRKPPTVSSMASTLDKLRKSNPEMTKGIDRIEEVLSAQASKPKGAAAAARSTAREVADELTADVPKPKPVTRGTPAGPTSLESMSREELLPILYRLQRTKSPDAATQKTLDRVLEALRKKPGPATRASFPGQKLTVAEDFGRAAKPGETAPLSHQSAMDTLARLRRKNPEMEEGISIIEQHLNQPRVRARTEGVRPSRSKAAVAERVATTPTRTADELKAAMKASLAGEAPRPAKAPGPAKVPGARPKPGEPGGRRLTAFEKAMRAQKGGAEPPAAAAVTPTGKPKGPTTPAAVKPKALGAEYDAYSAKVDELIKAEEFLADATPGSTVHKALTNRVAMLRKDVDKAFEIYKAKLPGKGSPVAQPVAAGGSRGPRKTAAAIGTRAGRVEKIRENFGGATPPPAAKPVSTPPPQVVKGPELGTEAVSGTTRAGGSVQPAAEGLPVGSTVELPVPAAPGTTVTKVAGKQAPAGKGNVHRVTFKDGKTKDIYFDRRREIWLDETGAVTGKTRGDIVKQLEELNEIPVPASTAAPELPGQLPKEPAFGPRLILEQLRAKRAGLDVIRKQLANNPSPGAKATLARTAQEMSVIDRRISEMAAKYDAPPVAPAAAPVKDALTEVRETFQPTGAPPPPPVPEPRSIRRPYAANEAAGREPWTAPAPAPTPPGGRGKYPRPPKVEAPAAAPAPTAEDARAVLKAAIARQKAADKALKKSAGRGMPSSAKVDTTLKAAATALRGRAAAVNKDLAPAANALADALTNAAENVAEKANKMKPRLMKNGKPILPKGGNPDPKGELGSMATDLMELAARLGVGAIGGAAGAQYGAGQAPEGEDKTGYKIAGAGTGALLGFLGSTAAINKLKGGSLANMAKRYQYFSLLSDPSVLGRATLGSMNSILTGMAEKVAEGNFRAAGRGLKRALKDTASGRYFRVLAAKDQSAHLPASMRVNYQGRAAVKPGYHVLDMPGRVITAGDTMASRALHEMGFDREAIMRLNLGGNPTSKLGQKMLVGLGEDVHYKTWTKGRTTKGGRRLKGGGVSQPKYTPPKLVEKIEKGKTSPGGDLLRRALIPFARMTVGLGERTLAYAPGINLAKPLRRAMSEIPGQMVSKRLALGRSALGAGSIAEGYIGSGYTDPQNDAWVAAAAGPMAGLSSLGILARRMMEKDQPLQAALIQAVQNIAPGVGEQLSPQIEKVIPSIAKVAAKTIDPAYERAKGPSETEEELKRTGEFGGGLGPEGPGALDLAKFYGKRGLETAKAVVKYRIPYLRETLPERYRPADKWGQPLYEDRKPFSFQMIPDTSLRGTIGGYRIIAPKVITGSSNLELPKWPMDDPISQHLRQLENVTGQTIMSPPSQPLRDPDLTQIAKLLGQVPPKLHRDMKEAIQGARGMAPRQAIAAQLSDPAFLAEDPQIQAMVLKAIVDKQREKVSPKVSRMGKASMTAPETRQMLIEALNQMKSGLRGPF